MAVKQARTAEDILDVAIAYVDEHGLEALTMRSLGEELGWHHTAVYRYYATRSDIVTAMVDHLIGQTMNAVPIDRNSPRNELLAIARAIRGLIREHPAVMQALPTITGTWPNSLAILQRVTDVMEAMGLHGDLLVTWSRLFEGIVIGSSLWDYASAPNHLSSRRLREQAIGHPALVAAYNSDSAVDRINESVFELGLATFVEQAVQAARS